MPYTAMVSYLGMQLSAGSLHIECSTFLDVRGDFKQTIMNQHYVDHVDVVNAGGVLLSSQIGKSEANQDELILKLTSPFNASLSLQCYIIKLLFLTPPCLGCDFSIAAV